VAKLLFDGDEVRELFEHARGCNNYRKPYGEEFGPALWLVHDQGVYLMSAGIPHLERPDNPEASKVAYADGCDPTKQEFDDWWHHSRELVGGDDFVEPIDLETFAKLFSLGLENIRVLINLTANKLVVSYTASRKKPKAKKPKMSVGIEDLEDF
jgi:hypothetical protein